MKPTDEYSVTRKAVLALIALSLAVLFLYPPRDGADKINWSELVAYGLGIVFLILGIMFVVELLWSARSRKQSEGRKGKNSQAKP